MTLAEIAESAGLPARTVRFYISRGLLPGPVKSGRGASYTADHLARLQQIQRLQADGQTLADIAGRLEGEPAGPLAASPTPWWQHAIADDVIVWVRAGAAPWRTKQVRQAVDEFARRVRPLDDGTAKESENI
jgi:DNA-binding transcriptional MerR regulator